MTDSPAEKGKISLYVGLYLVGFFEPANLEFPMPIGLPCGNSMMLNELPHKDIECLCGKLEYPHYFVKFNSGM